MRLYPATDAMRRVVVGTPAKEYHELGALMVAMLAAMYGWSVLYLGPDLPAEEIDTYVSVVGLDSLTERTITDPNDLNEELAIIREKGFAMSSGERQSGAASVAAAILDHDGHPIAAMSLCGPAERFQSEADAAARAVMAASRAISQQMGYRS